MKKLRSDTIKIIAMVAMLFDHIGYVILEKYYLSVPDMELAMRVFKVNSWVRGIGRIAFPLFCYMTVMGLVFTKSKWKYVKNLAIFTVVSEIPFNLATSGHVWDYKDQNVGFTLLLSSLCMVIIDMVQEKFELSRISAIIFNTGMVTLFSIIAELIKSDYGGKGVIIIATMYLLRENRENMIKWGAVAFIASMVFIMYLRYLNVPQLITYCNFEIIGIFAYPIMFMDTLKRKGGKALKWIGYSFYPVHQLVLFAIAKCMGVM